MKPKSLRLWRKRRKKFPPKADPPLAEKEFNRNLFTRIVIIVSLLETLTVINGCEALKSTGKPDAYYVKRVIDGDTIVLSNNERVRYIGINTPEMNHPVKGIERMAQEARDFNRRLVEHKWVKLEFDIEIRDKYGRLLAYVYVDNVFVNAELIKEGYAQVYTFPPNVKYDGLFLKLQREARENQRGLWGKN